MNERDDVGRAAPRSRSATNTRWVTRGLGVLVGLAVCLYAAALYALRCFDTCPYDPAENQISRLLPVALGVLGLVLIVAALMSATRWSNTGSWIIIAGGCVIAACGVATWALVPAIEAPGDHTDTARLGVLASLIGVAVVGGAIVLRRRSGQDAGERHEPST